MIRRKMISERYLRQIFVGDVHGCLDELRTLLERVRYTPGRDRLVFVGDLVDRGPESARTVRFVRTRAMEDGAVCVMGNHEMKYVRWRRRLAEVNGDPARVAMSFPDTKRAIYDELDEADHAWLASLLYFAVCGPYFVAHAGICPRRLRTRADLEHPRYAERLYRTRYLDDEGRAVDVSTPGASHWASGSDGRFGTVVYGHEPWYVVREDPHAIGIDTGCCFGGSLTAMVVEGGERRFVEVPAGRAYAPRRDVDDS
jgi:bis(5'-nucleosyl)-tetraphosphatase (symmetrical)